MLTRRDILVDGLAVSAALALGPGWARAARAGIPGRTRRRVLVVLQLSGGNDGLATLVPYRQDAYWRARPTLARPIGELARLTDEFALHGSMQPLAEHFHEGRLAAVHAVGYPRPDRSHFRSMEIWHTADPDGPAGDIGWMGRVAQALAAGSAGEPGAIMALHLGDGDLPLFLRGTRPPAPSLKDDRGLAIDPRCEGWAHWRDALCAGDADPDRGGDLVFLREAAYASYAAARRMSDLAAAPTPVAYPEGLLGRRLRLVARLVAGGFGTQLFHVELGGFDTHARQARTHAALLAEVGQGLDAFQRDLLQAGVADDVATFVFSEFGRRVRENGSRGTDHGVGAPVLLLGSGVRAGLWGRMPDLEALPASTGGDVPHTTDFRRIYATLERDWLGLPDGPASVDRSLRERADQPPLALFGT